MKTLLPSDAAAGDRRGAGHAAFRDQTRRLPFARCRALLERMLLADVRGKTGERDPRVELELVVLEMVGRMQPHPN